MRGRGAGRVCDLQGRVEMIYEAENAQGKEVQMMCQSGLGNGAGGYEGGEGLSGGVETSTEGGRERTEGGDQAGPNGIKELW